MYRLAIPMKYFLKENELAEVWMVFEPICI